MCSRNSCWTDIAGTGCTWLSFPGDEEQERKTQTQAWEAAEPGAYKSRLGASPAPAPWARSGMHGWCTLVMLLLPLHLQGGQGVQRAATLDCHLFDFWGGRYFHIRFIFAAVGMFSFPQWHTVIRLSPEEVRTRFATGFLGGRGM